MAQERLMAMVVSALGFSAIQTGPLDLPKPGMFARAEDQERARLFNEPCSEADIGHGCYRFAGRAMREMPCSYHIDDAAIGFRPTDQCYKMEEPRRFRGLWIDAFEGQQFIPEGTKAPEWPRTDSRSSGWREQFDKARAATIWLDVDRVKLGHDFRNGGRKMLIDFIGRKTAFPGSYGHMGMSGSEIIVDRVISLETVR